MPNSPGKHTIAASFTLPRPLMDAVREKARLRMTNKSDIIRRALMNDLTEEEREMVLAEIAALENGRYPAHQANSVALNEREKASSSRPSKATKLAKAASEKGVDDE